MKSHHEWRRSHSLSFIDSKFISLRGPRIQGLKAQLYYDVLDVRDASIACYAFLISPMHFETILLLISDLHGGQRGIYFQAAVTITSAASNRIVASQFYFPFSVISVHDRYRSPIGRETFSHCISHKYIRDT